MSDSTTATNPTLSLSGRSASRKTLITFAAASFILLSLGGWLTSLGMGPWYDALQKPWFQPPGWAFAPAWTTILTLLAIASWQVWLRAPSTLMRNLYVIQFLLNALWSLLFFTMGSPLAALVEILVLDATVVLMTVVYARVHAPSGWMVAPYAVWLMFATAINVGVVALN